MVHPSGDVTTYAYNGDGLRVLQDDGVAETRFVYDGNNLVLELDDVGVVKAETSPTQLSDKDAFSSVAQVIVHRLFGLSMPVNEVRGQAFSRTSSAKVKLTFATFRIP